MKRLLLVSVIATLLLAGLSIACAATNLNSSKSNIYRLTYPTDLVSQAQAKAILAELDKIGPANEAKLKQWLPANFKRHGVQADRVKKIVILPADKARKQITIILLSNPEDEPAAIAVSDEGVPSDKPGKPKTK